MSVVVVKQSEILTVVKKKEVTIIYTRNCGKFVCDTQDPIVIDADTVQYTLKGKRE